MSFKIDEVVIVIPHGKTIEGFTILEKTWGKIVSKKDGTTFYMIEIKDILGFTYEYLIEEEYMQHPRSDEWLDL